MPEALDAPTPPELDATARADAERILVDAFGVRDGYARLDSALSSSGVDLFKEVYAANMTMPATVKALADHLCAVSGAKMEAAIRALFIALAGDRAARAWVERHRPSLLPLVPPVEHEMARRAYEAARQAGRIGLVGEGLTRVAAHDTPLSPALRQMLTRAQEGLDRLGAFKQGHDFLHDLQTQTLVQADGLVRAADLPLDHDRLTKAFAQSVKDAVRRGEVLRVKAASVGLAADVDPIIDELVGLERELQGHGVTAPSTDAVEGARYRLRFMTRNHLPRLHSLLARTAGDIPFSGLQVLLDEAAGAEPSDDAALEDAGAALKALIPRLEETLKRHGLWQRIDQELWPLEESVIQPGSAFAGRSGPHWDAAISQLEALSLVEPSCGDLLETARRLRDEAATPGADRSEVLAFVRASRLTFQATDKTLLAQCEELLLLRPALRQILGES